MSVAKAPKRKLIEVALPLEAINRESAREKSIRHGHPSTLHLWWARRPLAACRAVIFASLVDDPSSNPEKFSTAEAQESERLRLFKIIEKLVVWENLRDNRVLSEARSEILASTDGKPPSMYDPFCGGGSIPLEAQRLGLQSHGSDLNPVAVLITKALIEIPPKFKDRPAVNPEARTRKTPTGIWNASAGLAADVRFYGQWMRDEAERRIGHLYPKAKLPKEQGGKEAPVVAWLWARTIKCPNPACGAAMPLVRSFALSTKKGKEVHAEPVRSGASYRFEVRAGGKPPQGTVSRRGARCICCESPVPFDYIRAEGQAGRIGAKLMATVAEGPTGRAYLSPDEVHTRAADIPRPPHDLDVEMPHNPFSLRPPLYGLKTFADIFTARQLTALTTFSDLVNVARERVLKDALAAGFSGSSEGLDAGGVGARAYADAVSIYLAFAISKVANLGSSVTSWMNDRGAFRETFARQAISMVWDFAESNPLAEGGGSLLMSIDKGAMVIDALAAHGTVAGTAVQADAATTTAVRQACVSTDPPYYNNIDYADLSDFFYSWLRPALKSVFPVLMATVQVPKGPELVASPYRFDGDKQRARDFFEEGLGRAFARMRDVQDPAFPLTVYYAFKQSEREGDDDEADDDDASNAHASTGWETMLEGLVKAGFSIAGTWPMRTEMATRSMGQRMNALASSIVLVCRPRPVDAPVATRSDFLKALKRELPLAMRNLQRGNIAPVDLAQSAIGPGMAVFSRYSKVLDTKGEPVRVREALSLINQVLDEVLAEQEGDFDADTRWALAWFEQAGFDEGKFGEAETLSKAKNTSVSGLVSAGILHSKGGRVHLLRPEELPSDWNPSTDTRLTVWESTHHLIRVLAASGEAAAADLARRLGGQAAIARELAYRLYSLCERKKRSQEALAYNSLVQSWPEIARLAQDGAADRAEQPTLFKGEA